MPDPDAVGGAIHVSRRRGSKVIFDIHEDFDGAAAERWAGRLLSAPAGKAIRRWIGSNVERADLVCGVSDGVLAPYRALRPDTIVLQNSTTLAFADACLNGRRPPPERFTLIHGLLGIERGTGELCDALADLQRNLQIDIVAFGDARELAAIVGRDRAAALTEPHADVRVRLLERVPYAAMPSVLTGCSAGLLSYTGRLATASLPNRLFEYMAAGLPVIAPLQSPEIMRLLESHECGVSYDQSNPASLTQAIELLASSTELRARLGSAGEAGFRRGLSWEVQFRLLLVRMAEAGETQR